jgi:hypothetical protein
MVNWYMIEFKYLGESHFANVFEYGSLPTYYHVQLIHWHEHTGGKIILKKTADGIELSDTSRPAHKELVESIIQKIVQHKETAASNLPPRLSEGSHSNNSFGNSC